MTRYIIYAIIVIGAVLACGGIYLLLRSVEGEVDKLVEYVTRGGKEDGER